MTDASQLDRALLDLRKIQAVCTRRNLDQVPDIGMRYLTVNAELLTYYVTQLYATTTREQRRQLGSANARLDASAIDAEFSELATSALRYATADASNPALKGLLRTTPDELKMLIRALEYAACCSIAPPDLQLGMSPIERYGLTDYLAGAAPAGPIVEAISWDNANALYADAKVAAFEECRNFGLELSEPRQQPRAADFDAAVRQGTRIVMELLRARAEMDIAIVQMVAPGRRASYHAIIDSRLNSEFLNVLDAVRDALVHLVEHYSPLLINVESAQQLTRLQKMSIGINVQNALAPLLAELSDLRERIPVIQPDPGIMSKLHRLRAHAGVTVMGDVFQNVKDSTIISRSVVENWTQQQRGIDLATLEDELSALRLAMRERASTPEEDIALGQVASAERAAKEGDGPRVLQHLKTAGQWAFKVATEIGTKVATDAIQKAAGLG